MIKGWGEVFCCTTGFKVSSLQAKLVDKELKGAKGWGVGPGRKEEKGISTRWKVTVTPVTTIQKSKQRQLHCSNTTKVPTWSLHFYLHTDWPHTTSKPHKQKLKNWMSKKRCILICALLYRAVHHYSKIAVDCGGEKEREVVIQCYFSVSHCKSANSAREAREGI